MTIAEMTPPDGEPLTLAEVKAHLRLSGSAEDDLLSGLITAARQYLERETGLVLMTAGFRLYLDNWPDGPVIQIGRSPVQTIDAVTVYDDLGDASEADTTGMVLDGRAHPARLILPRRVRPGQSLNGIEIDFTAGFGASGADVPDTLKRALLLHIALLHEFRGAVAPENHPAAVPAGYERLIAPFRRRGL